MCFSDKEYIGTGSYFTQTGNKKKNSNCQRGMRFQSTLPVTVVWVKIKSNPNL